MSKEIDWINREVACIYDILCRVTYLTGKINKCQQNPGEFYENVDRVAALYRLLSSTDVMSRMYVLIDFADHHVNKSYNNAVELPDDEEESDDHG